MAQFNVKSEKPLTMSEVADRLGKIEKRDKELTFRGNKTKEYLEHFVSKEKTSKLRKKLDDLGITRLKERHIVKIIDIKPEDMDSLKTILSNEALTLKEEDLKKILGALKE